MVSCKVGTYTDKYGKEAYSCVRKGIFHSLCWIIYVVCWVVNAILWIFYGPYRFYHHLKKKATKQPRVVICGASFCGLTAARHLWTDFDVTLIDFKDYFEYVPGILRPFVNIKWLFRLTSPMSSSMMKTFVHGEVTAIAPTSVEVSMSDGKNTPVTIPFDYCIVSIGSLYESPIRPGFDETDLQKRYDVWKKSCAELERAEQVIIVGAGPVGVELAAEVAEEMPEKKIIIIEGMGDVLPPFPEHCRNDVRDWLEARNVEIRLNTFTDMKSLDKTGVKLACNSVTKESLAHITVGKLPDGKSICYKCIGFQPNTKPLEKHFSEHLNKQRGHPLNALLVNEFLQIPGHPTIMAGGDVMSSKVCPAGPGGEIKLGLPAELCAHVCVHNIYEMEECKKTRAEPHYHTYPEDVCQHPATKKKSPDYTTGAVLPFISDVSLGEYQCVLNFNFFAWTGVLSAVVKWLLEWTQVGAALERPIGCFFWDFALVVAPWMNRTVLDNTGTWKLCGRAFKPKPKVNKVKDGYTALSA